MPPVVIDRTLHYGDVKILVAHDEDERCFIGLNTSPRLRGTWVFIEVHPATVDQLEALTVDLHTVVTERRLGSVFTAQPVEVVQWRAGREPWAAWPAGRPAVPPSHPGRPG